MHRLRLARSRGVDEAGFGRVWVWGLSTPELPVNCRTIYLACRDAPPDAVEVVNAQPKAPGILANDAQHQSINAIRFRQFPHGRTRVHPSRFSLRREGSGITRGLGSCRLF